MIIFKNSPSSPRSLGSFGSLSSSFSRSPRMFTPVHRSYLSQEKIVKRFSPGSRLAKAGKNIIQRTGAGASHPSSSSGASSPSSSNQDPNSNSSDSNSKNESKEETTNDQNSEFFGKIPSGSFSTKHLADFQEKVDLFKQKNLRDQIERENREREELKEKIFSEERKILKEEFQNGTFSEETVIKRMENYIIRFLGPSPAEPKLNELLPTPLKDYENNMIVFYGKSSDLINLYDVMPKEHFHVVVIKNWQESNDTITVFGIVATSKDYSFIKSPDGKSITARHNDFVSPDLLLKDSFGNPVPGPQFTSPEAKEYLVLDFPGSSKLIFCGQEYIDEKFDKQTFENIKTMALTRMLNENNTNLADSKIFLNEVREQEKENLEINAQLRKENLELTKKFIQDKQNYDEKVLEFKTELVELVAMRVYLATVGPSFIGPLDESTTDLIQNRAILDREIEHDRVEQETMPKVVRLPNPDYDLLD